MATFHTNFVFLFNCSRKITNHHSYIATIVIINRVVLDVMYFLVRAEARGHAG